MSLYTWIVSAITGSGSSFSEILFLSDLVDSFSKANSKTGNNFKCCHFKSNMHGYAYLLHD